MTNQHQKEQSYFLNQIYKDKTGYIYSLDLSGRIIQRAYAVNEILDSTFQGQDIFVTPNSFVSTTSREESNLKSLNAFFIDLDLYKLNLTVEATLKSLKQVEFGRSVPFPSIVIRSGNGLYLIWLIEAENSSKLDEWATTQKNLCKILTKYGSDPKSLDASRVLRIPGTINGKANCGKIVEIETEYDTNYSFSDIAEWANATLEEQGQLVNVPLLKRASTPIFETTGKGQKGLYRRTCKQIADDLEIILLSKSDPRGYREAIFFWYRHFLVQSNNQPLEIKRKMLNLNAKLIYPLAEKELFQNTASATKKTYHPSIGFLLKSLAVSPETQAKLSVLVLNKTKSAKTKKKNPLRKQLQRNKILHLRASGYKMDRIAQFVGVSRQTCYNLISGHKGAIPSVSRKNKARAKLVLLSLLKHLKMHPALLLKKSRLNPTASALVQISPYLLNNIYIYSEGQEPFKPCHAGYAIATDPRARNNIVLNSQLLLSAANQ